MVGGSPIWVIAGARPPRSGIFVAPTRVAHLHPHRIPEILNHEEYLIRGQEGSMPNGVRYEFAHEQLERRDLGLQARRELLESRSRLTRRFRTRWKSVLEDGLHESPVTPVSAAYGLTKIYLLPDDP